MRRREQSDVAISKSVTGANAGPRSDSSPDADAGTGAQWRNDDHDQLGWRRLTEDAHRRSGHTRHVCEQQYAGP